MVPRRTAAGRASFDIDRMVAGYESFLPKEAAG